MNVVTGSSSSTWHPLKIKKIKNDLWDHTLLQFVLNKKGKNNIHIYHLRTNLYGLLIKYRTKLINVQGKHIFPCFSIQLVRSKNSMSILHYYIFPCFSLQLVRGQNSMSILHYYRDTSYFWINSKREGNKIIAYYNHLVTGKFPRFSCISVKGAFMNFFHFLCWKVKRNLFSQV